MTFGGRFAGGGTFFAGRFSPNSSPLARYNIGGKAPAVVADYSAGVYGLDGRAVTFDGLFDFARLSAAWKLNALGHWVKALAGEPRTGHHIWQGGKLVPAGVAICSEVRTNNILRSEDFTNSAWLQQGTVITGNADTSPTGAITADLSTGVASTVSGVRSLQTWVSGTIYSASIFVKRGTSDFFQIGFPANFAGSTMRANFDMVTGVLGTVDAGITASIQELGDGWYRLSATATATNSAADRLNFTHQDSASATYFAASGATTVLLFGAQLEAGPFATDYISTDGAQVSTAAESLQIDPVKLAKAIGVQGSELVVNGTFDTDTSGWTPINAGDLTWQSGTARIRSTGGNFGAFTQTVTTVIGQLYLVEFDAVATTGAAFRFHLDGVRLYNSPATGRQFLFFTATSTSTVIECRTGSTETTAYTEWDNITFRSLTMPDELTFLMKGTMTYADNDLTVEGEPFSWTGGSLNFIDTRLRTQSSRTGQIEFRQRTPLGGQTILASATDALAPGVEVPFALAFVLSATDLEGFVNGVSTGKVAYGGMANLLSSPLHLLQSGTATLEEFHIWAEALPSAAMIEATS